LNAIHDSYRDANGTCRFIGRKTESFFLQLLGMLHTAKTARSDSRNVEILHRNTPLVFTLLFELKL